MTSLLRHPSPSAPDPAAALARPGRTAGSSGRSLDRVTGPLDQITARSASLLARDPARFSLGGESHALPRYLFLGPQGGDAPLRIGLFAGLHGDEPAAIFGLLRFVQLLEQNPELARGYCLFLYPVANPTGFLDHTRHNRNGRDLNREFWCGSEQPEVRHLEQDLLSLNLHGLISLHTDNTSSGLYGYAHGSVLTEHLVRPALRAAAEILPRNEDEIIDGFPAREGIIAQHPEGILCAPPGQQPRPFEVILETPDQAPHYLQESALVMALSTLIGEYRQLVAHARDL